MDIDMITTLHSDIINSHILTRLDGPTLASAAASSSHLRRLCTQHHLWTTICASTWPSLTHPLAAHLISTLPNQHRSIFSDSFPSLHPSALHNNQNPPPSPSPELISAVDIYYNGQPVFSRVHRTETQKGWFLCSPLWIDILEPNETVPTPLKFAKSEDDDDWLRHVQENLELSWILIDPSLKRAANLSSRRAVSARRHWLTGEAEVVYAVGVEEGGAQCAVKVTCCGKSGGEMQVREVSLTMEDLDGRHVMGRDSMVILQRAMESSKRKKVDVGEAKERYEKFCDTKIERREMRIKKEKAMDTLAMFVAFTVFVTLFCFLRFYVCV
ncbi:hypothetical protein HN51_043111 [Arachis hypogaea]|uniref:F-box domain-containing protein n=1 Tax=Arachis hypogaea TaxID=3818 RepID=A0A444Y7F8_ARAHY|nr:F-box protein At2g27310 [Arachis ipaensis]XP_025669773.1 F-box protein At2g27310 [Arachis hypogaea]QHN95238.1 F-box protein [Arachis hypogaea]RYQ97787.1 hypothetical protein Ahy_B08g093865 [Arachis hypogaea]